MIGMDWLDEMALFLKQKQVCINIALNYYSMIEDTERQNMIEALFNKIDEELEQIHELDLLFLSKFDKFKRANNIQELSELNLADQNQFVSIKTLIREISEPQQLLELHKKNYSIKKQEISKNRIDTKQKTQAFAAYKRTNK